MPQDRFEDAPLAPPQRGFGKLAGAVALALLLAAPALSAQRPARAGTVVGVVLDGASPVTDSVRQAFEVEVGAFFGAASPVRFPATARLAGDWTAAGAAAAIDRLLADTAVDVVLTLGPIGSQELARRRLLAKPVIAALVIDASAQGLPGNHQSSGVRNLAYIDGGFTTSRALDAFHQLVPFRHLVLVAQPGVSAALPALVNRLEARVGSLGATLTKVPVSGSAAEALAALPPDADAIYLGPHDQLSAAGFDSLVAGFHRRHLPTLSALGRSDVERGILATYASRDDLARRARRVASTLQRIRAGEDAGTLPVALPAVPQLVLNLQTARSIGFSPSWNTLTEAELLHEDAAANGPVWSLAAVGQEALTANLDLQAANQSLASGRQALRISRAALLPQVQAEATGTMIREETAAASFGQQAQRQSQGRVVFSQVIYDEQSWANLKINGYAQDGRVAERQRTRLDAVLRATTAYLDLLRSKAVARVERENLALTRSNLETAQLKEQIGAAGLSDVYRWQAELAQGRRKVLDADARVQLAALELNGSLNRPLEEAFQTSDAGVDDPALLISEPRLLSYLGNPATFAVFRDFVVAEGVRNSPEIQGIEAQLHAEERKGTAASRSRFIPTVSLEGGVSSVLSRGGAGADAPTIAGIPVGRAPDNTWSLQLKAALPLFTGLAREAQRAQASSEVDRLLLVRQSATLQLSQQIRGALQLAAASWVNIQQAREAAEAARKNLEIVSDAYGRGTVTVLTLLDAQQAALEANEAAANAVYGFLIDLMQAQRASGSFDFFHSAAERELFYQRLDEYFRTHAPAALDH